MGGAVALPHWFSRLFPGPINVLGLMTQRPMADDRISHVGYHPPGVSPGLGQMVWVPAITPPAVQVMN
ncbi:hypothetical protein GCM10010449_23890 [Streptomyces rectiviolaceus]|uniref:Uncharacterized protein n=1 Tax=Streptomyces rectiviolaceus TaxID=332591 RepID=A0ABP6MCH8_9ACTN